MLVHSLFDALALLAALAVYRLVPAAAPGAPEQPWQVHRLYIAAGSLGRDHRRLPCRLGQPLAHRASPGSARSIEGAIAGGIVAIEALKWRNGIRGSTGLRFVAPLAAAIAVGRLGCFFAGLDDMTYGTPTALPWGVDFGDGIARHPVQLYEAAAMTLILRRLRAVAAPGGTAVRRTGFYLFIGVYAAQRFAWEFLKPYATVIGPFNLFHLLSLALVAYALVFACREMRQPCRILPPLST